MAQKRIYMLLGVILVCVGIVVILQWQLPQEGLSQETAARLEAIGLDPGEFSAYPDEVMDDLLSGLEMHDFLWASVSSNEVTLLAHPSWDGVTSETTTVKGIPGQPLETELHAFILLDRKEPSRVHCVRLLGAFQWTGGPSAKKDMACALLAYGPDFFHFSELYPYCAADTTPRTCLDALRAAPRMIDTNPMDIFQSGVAHRYDYQKGSSGIIAAGLAPKEPVFIDEWTDRSFFLQFRFIPQRDFSDQSGSLLTLSPLAWHQKAAASDVA